MFDILVVFDINYLNFWDWGVVILDNVNLLKKSCLRNEEII